MALVLCTGVDPVLLTTRKLILEHAGHKVVTATDELTVKAACEQQAFDVAVIGRAVSALAKRRLLMVIRRHCPSAQILELYRFNSGRILEDADSWLEVPADVPQELAERVTALAARRQEQAH
jgi:DNA-binding response OmpR family regulator